MSLAEPFFFFFSRNIAALRFFVALWIQCTIFYISIQRTSIVREFANTNANL